MLSNQFFNMQFKDVELYAFFIDNKMYTVTFENTILTGVMEETPQAIYMQKKMEKEAVRTYRVISNDEIAPLVEAGEG